jgi:hypothetical protein
VATREGHTVLGKNRIGSGREEAFKAHAVSSGSNQEGSVLLAVFLRFRSCSDSYLRCLYQCRQFGWHRMVPFVGLGQSAHLQYYGVL